MWFDRGSNSIVKERDICMPIPLGEARMVAVIGAGGKTTTLGLLAQAHRNKRVLLTTTTHIRPFSSDICQRLLCDPTSQELEAALSLPGVTCAGAQKGTHKLSALSNERMELARTKAQLVIYEADGARMLPLKLHRSFEPVILPHTDLCIVVAGLSALGHAVQDCVHCYHLHSHWAQHPQLLVDEEVVLHCIQDAMQAGGLPLEKYHVLLNQADTPQQAKAAVRLRDTLAAQGISCTIRPAP